MRIIAFDFETGGLSADRHAITQLAVVACEARPSGVTIPTLDRSQVERFVRVWTVRPAPGLMIEEDALRIQGHTRQSLLRRPEQVTEAQLMKQLQEFFAGLDENFACAPLVAHNAKFDHGFLDALCRRAKAPLPARHVLCTLERQRELVRRKSVAKADNNKLGTLAKLLGLEQDEAHDALQDTKLCAALFAWQEHLLASSGNLLEESDDKLVGLVYEHVPAATDGWWTAKVGTFAKHGEEFPVKPVGAPITATIAPAKPTPPETPRPVFSVSKELCELHRRAKGGELDRVEGFSSRSGPVEDANRFVIGAFRNILSTLEDLEKLAKIQQKHNQNA